jgi:hypothetical protein
MFTFIGIEKLPVKAREIILKYAKKEETQENNEKMLRELEEIGFLNSETTKTKQK